MDVPFPVSTSDVPPVSTVDATVAVATSTPVSVATEPANGRFTPTALVSPSPSVGGVPTASAGVSPTAYPTYSYPGYPSVPPPAMVLTGTVGPPCTTDDPCYYVLQLRPISEASGAAIVGCLVLYVVVFRFVVPSVRIVLMLSLLFVCAWYLLTLQAEGLWLWIVLVAVLGTLSNIFRMSQGEGV